MTSNFIDYLSTKPISYKKIDHTRIKIAYSILKKFIKKPLIIHIVGTNGKGSTGRILASLLYQENIQVGHFSSPHILKFNERIWINGKDILDTELEKYHKELFFILGKDISDFLSYFEYTTLLSFLIMQNLKVVILEAGLGGEFDATNVIDKELSIICPIGIDHQDFLGKSILEIATTKINSISKQALIGFQKFIEVYKISYEIALKKNSKIFFLKDLVKKEESRKIFLETQKIDWAEFLYENTLLAIYALKILNFPYNIKNIKNIKLFGRYQKISQNIIIDVGHNLLAVNAIIKTLKKDKNQQIILIFNSAKDKDYVSIFKKFKYFIKRVEIISIKNERMVNKNLLIQTLNNLNILYKDFDGTIIENEKYFIFGSFYVIESFLKNVKII